ncbi:hypothetical protein BDP55DRAFT_263366 [Colletotrichum godetiae]|uniref:Secreted protein n=1 Tax=Colletotrichum godetiae TaxID=1209918 RepID=A0AAJ0AVZ1_9PEZI|nr:uncharacterized protein BDP55DRAFT_263366 [Colletotrichum godetiae]KAK1691386.1 hypothetical protein BDP55DRAFT_263366 [Colletotrichum godetiae]
MAVSLFLSLSPYLPTPVLTQELDIVRACVRACVCVCVLVGASRGARSGVELGVGKVSDCPWEAAVRYVDVRVEVARPNCFMPQTRLCSGVAGISHVFVLYQTQTNGGGSREVRSIIALENS